MRSESPLFAVLYCNNPDAFSGLCQRLFQKIFQSVLKRIRLARTRRLFIRLDYHVVGGLKRGGIASTCRSGGRRQGHSPHHIRFHLE